MVGEISERIHGEFPGKIIEKKSLGISEGIEQNSEQILAGIREDVRGGTPKELIGVIAKSSWQLFLMKFQTTIQIKSIRF